MSYYAKYFGLQLFGMGRETGERERERRDRKQWEERSKGERWSGERNFLLNPIYSNNNYLNIVNYRLCICVCIYIYTHNRVQSQTKHEVRKLKYTNNVSEKFLTQKSKKIMAYHRGFYLKISWTFQVMIFKLMLGIYIINYEIILLTMLDIIFFHSITFIQL